MDNSRQANGHSCKQKSTRNNNKLMRPIKNLDEMDNSDGDNYGPNTKYTYFDSSQSSDVLLSPPKNKRSKHR